MENLCFLKKQFLEILILIVQILGFGSQNANDVQPIRKLTREEEEREVRRQRRLRRRSDCQSMFPQGVLQNRKDSVSHFSTILLSILF